MPKRRRRLRMKLPEFRKVRYLKIMVLSLCWLVASTAQAQTGSADEMQLSTGGPAGTGPTVAAQTVTMRLNTDNPAGNTFAAPLVPLTATYSLSNQQYTGYSVAQGFPLGSGGNGVVFGADTPSSASMLPVAIYQAMNAYGSPTNSMFTSYNAPAGQGIDVSANGAIELLLSAKAISLSASPPSTSSRVRMADLTITFNRPVNNPIIHITGAGANYFNGFSTLGFTAEFDLLTAGATLTRLSGDTVFSATSTQINNSAANPSPSCASNVGACGSVRVNGTQLTSVTFRLYLRGNGGTSAWSDSSLHSADALTVGVSLDPQSQISLQKTTTNGTGTFNYTVTGANPPGTASLTTATAGTAVSTATPLIIPSSFTQINAVEAIPANWVVASISCTKSGGTITPTYNVATGTATISAADAAPNSSYTCSYTNRLATANMSITKDDGKTAATSGTTTTYTVVASNTGPDSGNNSTIKDVPGAGLSGCVATCTATSGGAVCPATPSNLLTSGGVTMTTFPAGSNVTFQVTCNVN